MLPIMSKPRVLSLVVLTFVLIILGSSSASAASAPPATSFCKCICFNNSTIIPLTPDSPSSDASRDHHQLTCSDCNRAFCLDYNLPICKGAREEDVFATCFRRDSVKDKTVVIIFVVATAGLLGWAVIKPWVQKIRDAQGLGDATDRRYAPVNENSGDPQPEHSQSDPLAEEPSVRT